MGFKKVQTIMNDMTIQHNTKSVDEFAKEIAHHVNGRFLTDDVYDYSEHIIETPYKFYKGDKEYSLSIQASRTHYCHPRDNVSEYTKVELMIWDTAIKISDNFEKLYGDGSIYAFVPIEAIAQELYNFCQMVDEDVCGGCGVSPVKNYCCDSCYNMDYESITKEDKEQADWYFKNYVEK